MNEVRGIKNKDINPDYLKDIRIPTIALHQQGPIIELVDNIIEFNYQLNNCNTPNEKRLLENQIKIIDEQINKMVYELYGLTEEEITIIEELGMFNKKIRENT